jgi:hypothetical protein
VSELQKGDVVITHLSDGSVQSHVS